MEIGIVSRFCQRNQVSVGVMGLILLLGGSVTASAQGPPSEQSSEELAAVVVTARPEESFEERFFADCPDRPRLRVHSDASAKDPHAILYTAANLMELEVIRLADWLIDLPVVGREVRPLEGTVDGIRASYARLGKHLLLRRFGELVDAFQLRELSLGDVAAGYSGGPGGSVSPGSGTVARVNKLIDWAQHVTGDINGGLGRTAGRPAGLITWSLPGRTIDRGQRGLIRVFHWASVTVARMLDQGIAGAEGGVEVVVNVPRPAPHRLTTVFVRVPLETYRRYEPWIRRRGSRIYAGTAEDLLQLTHAQLFHHHRRRQRAAAQRAWPDSTTHVMLVMSARTFSTAPNGLAPYVIPAAWVGQPSPAHAGATSPDGSGD